MSDQPTGVAGLMQRFNDPEVRPAAVIGDPPPNQVPDAPTGAEAWTADDVTALEASYRGCLNEEQTAAWTADRMEGILGELKRLHGIG